MNDWPFGSIWLVDFEFGAQPGERQDVRCVVALELKSDRLIRLWRDQLGPEPPYGVGAKDLFVAYYASAEIGCHLSLGWQRPVTILDLFTEFRNHTNGICKGASLLDALAHFGLNGIGSLEKDEMRALMLRGGTYTDQEKMDGLDYCESDVRALQRLLPAMSPHIDLERALVRGRFMRTAAAIEFAGTPTDLPMLTNRTRTDRKVVDLLEATVAVQI